MARETLKDFLRNEDLDEKNPDGSISYTVVGVADGSDPRNLDSSGLGVETNSDVPLIGFDMPVETIGLTGNYLKHITDAAGNLYSFSRGNSKTQGANRGDYLVDADTFIESIPFVSQGTTEDSLMEQYSNSGYFDNPETEDNDELEDIISKVDGAARGTGPNSPRRSNELLKDVFVPVEGGDETDFVVKATVDALKRKNRFNMDEEDNYVSMVSPGATIESNDNISFVRGQEDYYTNLSKLKDVATSLILKSSGYDINEDPQNEDDYIVNLEKDASEGSKEESLNAPGVDGAAKINAKILRPKNATGVPTLSESGESVRTGTGVNIEYDAESNNASSFGSTYNSTVRFNDRSQANKMKTAFRMIAFAKIIRAAYDEVITNLNMVESEIIKDGIKKIAASSNTVTAGAQILGLSRKSSKFVANNYLFDNFLTPTDFGYEECFNRGVAVVFGESESDSGKINSNLSKIYDAPGFWTAIANATIKKTFRFSDTLMRLAEDSSPTPPGSKEAVKAMIDEFGSAAKIANVFAMIGEKSLHHSNAAQNTTKVTDRVTNVRDPDALDDIPGNRVGKSRKKNKKSGGGLNANGSKIGSETTLAWEQGAVPSTYLLPLNIIRAASDLNNARAGANPARGMLGSRMVRNTYTGLDTDGTGARIPNRVVKIVEDRLGAEYVPFYFHDLRTNEIIAFHAFLNQLTDNITSNHTATQGYGRLDPVQTYQSTTRSLQVGFTVYSTNKQDFDEMWYKINKLVTLLYPQWTQGQIVKVGDISKEGNMFNFGIEADGAKFVQPFTQTIGASPVIRLRIGDVVKSNYSRFALARTFGIGDQGVIAQPVGTSVASLGMFTRNFIRKVKDVAITVVAAIFGSPQGLIQIGMETAEGKIDNGQVLGALGGAADAATAALAEILINGYANPLMTYFILRRLRDPNTFGGDGFINIDNALVYINPNMIDGYHSLDGPRIFTSKRLLAKVKKKVKDDTGEKEVYQVEVFSGPSGVKGKKILVRHEDIWNDPGETYSKSTAGLIFTAAGLDAVGLIDTLAGNPLRSTSGAGGAALNIAVGIAKMFLENPEATFMRPEFNPYTKAFHTTRGRGLAGVMGGISFNWIDDFPWETDYNSRAPIGCQISFNFDVIHDIPPGIDHTGYNRAPLYNVGEVMRNVAGDVYDETFSAEEDLFRAGGATGLDPGTHVRKTGKK